MAALAEGRTIMSNEERNVAILKRAFGRWNDEKAASYEFWLELMADDVTFGSLGAGHKSIPFSAPRNAKDDVRGYFRDLTRDWAMQHYTVTDFIADGDVVVVRGRTAWTHKETGKVGDTPFADFVRMRDGKIVDFFEFYDTQAVIAAATK
jgi:uncharacterized protein